MFLPGEPGSTLAYARALPEGARLLVHSYIEGSPIINERWRNVLANVNTVAASKFGADTIKMATGKDVPWVYPGVDHSVFNVTGTRDELRKRHNVEGKFVIMCVAQNVRRKQLPRLIEAVSILRYKHKRNDIVLYMHSSPFQEHWLDGWNLIEIEQAYGVADITIHHPGLFGGLHAFVSERTDDIEYPGLVEMYNMADLFVLPSQVEGFGLPIAEAMACGLPVAVTKYGAGWEIANPAGRGLPVHDWEIHKSGMKYANVAPTDIADVILKLIRNPNELRRMREAGLARAQDFDWKNYQKTIVAEAERIVNGDQASGNVRQEEDSSTPPREEAEHLREDAPQGKAAGLGLQPAR